MVNADLAGSPPAAEPALAGDVVDAAAGLSAACWHAARRGIRRGDRETEAYRCATPRLAARPCQRDVGSPGRLYCTSPTAHGTANMSANGRVSPRSALRAAGVVAGPGLMSAQARAGAVARAHLDRRHNGSTCSIVAVSSGSTARRITRRRPWAARRASAFPSPTTCPGASSGTDTRT
jgi:hypothetical protein